jgi:hypothetical protein
MPEVFCNVTIWNILYLPYSLKLCLTCVYLIWLYLFQSKTHGGHKYHSISGCYAHGSYEILNKFSKKVLLSLKKYAYITCYRIVFYAMKLQRSHTFTNYDIYYTIHQNYHVNNKCTMFTSCCNAVCGDWFTQP